MAPRRWSWLSAPAYARACVVGGAALSLLACPKSGTLDRPGVSDLAVASARACSEGTSDDPRALACRRWACGRAALIAPSWDGDERRCLAGAPDPTARDRALRIVNAYRLLAGVPEVAPEPAWDEPAQQCALLAHANRRLSHEPPSDWACWSELGARASRVSLVANRSAPFAIDPFIEDPGNDRTMVHRRWLLGTELRRLGLGSTSAFACALVDGREWGASAEVEPVSDARPWVAWPPPGPVPIDLFRRTRLDRTGWTVQSSSLDLDGAEVEVLVRGVRRHVTVAQLERGQGSLTAVRFTPDGWATEAGEEYRVRIARDAIAIDFTVAPVDCP